MEKLQFIDEYPRVTERLKDDPYSDTTVCAIVNVFQFLPTRKPL